MHFPPKQIKQCDENSSRITWSCIEAQHQHAMFDSCNALLKSEKTMFGTCDSCNALLKSEKIIVRKWCEQKKICTKIKGQ